MTLEEAVQLHQVIHIRYRVTHWIAQLYTADGDELVVEISGDTIDAALEKLKIFLAPYEREQFFADFWKGMIPCTG